MAITLPLPVRVAAGLLATGIQLVRSLPEEIPAIPVALVGNAMRLSMKVQQEITTLATRGDELLGGIIGGRPQESPSWATFDEDTRTAPLKAAHPRTAATAPAAPPAAPRPPAARSAEATPSTTATPRAETPTVPAANTPTVPAAKTPTVPAAKTPTVPAAENPTGPADTPTVAAAENPTGPADTPTVPADAPVLHTPEATALSDTPTTAAEAAAEVSDAVLEAATHAVPEPSAADDTAAPAEPVADGSATPQASADHAAQQVSAEPAADDGPATLPGYDTMTLAQVRGHLRELSAPDVAILLAYEQAGDNRAPFLTLLSNRLVTLGASDS